MIEEVIVVQGEYPSSEEQFYYQWGEETEKAIPGQLLDTLKQLVTLNTALIGGSLVGLREDLMPAGCRLVVVGFFILSLLAAMVGIVPGVQTFVPYNQPAAVRDHKQAVVARRASLIRAAAMFLIAGFAAVFVGLVWKAVA